MLRTAHPEERSGSSAAAAWPDFSKPCSASPCFSEHALYAAFYSRGPAELGCSRCAEHLGSAFLAHVDMACHIP